MGHHTCRFYWLSRLVWRRIYCSADSLDAATGLLCGHPRGLPCCSGELRAWPRPFAFPSPPCRWAWGQLAADFSPPFAGFRPSKVDVERTGCPTWLLVTAALSAIGLPLLMAALRGKRAQATRSRGLQAASRIARRTLLDPSKRWNLGLQWPP